MNLDDTKDALIDALRENGELRAQLKEAREALGAFLEFADDGMDHDFYGADEAGLLDRARAALGEKAKQ